MPAVVANGLSWIYRADNVIAGIENPIDISAEITFIKESDSVVGENLWRLGLFGSRNQDGSGERFNYVSQVLDQVESSYDLLSQTLTYDDATAMFDVAAIGCTEFVYGCMEFTNSPNASAKFDFAVLPEGDTITLCKESPCLANVKITDVRNVNLDGGMFQSFTPNNPLPMRVSVTGAEVGVAGTGLWRLRAFGSQNQDGSGERYGESVQVLTTEQQDQMLGLDRPMVFQTVDFNFDASDVSCAQARFVCVELEKGLEPDVVFNIIPVPDPSTLVSCTQIQCQGLRKTGTSPLT